jgi:septal ring factor EnvC (AmiA/AmiB activator)
MFSIHMELIPGGIALADDRIFRFLNPIAASIEEIKKVLTQVPRTGRDVDQLKDQVQRLEDGIKAVNTNIGNLTNSVSELLIDMKGIKVQTARVGNFRCISVMS